MTSLRCYQQDAVNAVMTELSSSSHEPFLIKMPTGTGKSIVIAAIVGILRQAYSWLRVVILTHSKELVEQNGLRYISSYPSDDVGFCSAAMGKWQPNAAVVFGGIDSVIGRMEELGRRDILLIDEAHRINVVESTSYAVVIKHLRSLNSNMAIGGLTATDYRMGQGLLTEPYNDRRTGMQYPALFKKIIVDQCSPDKFVWFIDQGYLVPLIPKATRSSIDLKGAKTGSDGDYVQKHLANQVHEKLDKMLDEVLEYGEERRTWLIFAAGIDNAHEVAEALRIRGIPAEVLTAGTKKKVRADMLSRFKNGSLRCIVNNDVLTTGFDCPRLDMIVVLRATKSTSLWVQILGRGTRPEYAVGFDLSDAAGRLAAIEASEKQNCLVLDFANNSSRLGAINNPVIPSGNKEGKSTGDAIMKVCPECYTFNYASVRYCTQCGNEFVFKDKTAATASEDQLIYRAEPVINQYDVDGCTYSIKQLPYGGEVLNVTYRTANGGKFAERIDFAHPRARSWWKGAMPVPVSAKEATQRLAEIRQPRRITVWMNNPNKRTPEVTGYEW